MIPVISPQNHIGAESRTKHDALSGTGSECTEGPWSAFCSDRGPPLRPTTHWAPRSQGSGLTVLSPQIISTNEIRGNKGGL